MTLWLGFLVCVLRGFSSQRPECFRGSLCLHGIWGQPPQPVTDVAIYKRLAQAAPTLFMDLFNRVTVRLSADGGRTWPAARLLHPGPAAYSSLVALPGGAIGCFYERGDRSSYERITFARFPREWLAAGQ